MSINHTNATIVYGIITLSFFIHEPIRLSTNFLTLIPNLTFNELRIVSMEHLQRMWHARRNAYPSGHLVTSSFLGVAYAPIVETSFTKLAVSFLDLLLEYPLVLSRFFMIPIPIFCVLKFYKSTS